MSKEKMTFEEAFSRLEAILESMNKEKISLDDSLKLFEEASALINLCSTRLSDAEAKIETLLKNRNGEVALNKEGRPIVENFIAQRQQILNSSDEQPVL